MMIHKEKQKLEKVKGTLERQGTLKLAKLDEIWW